MQYKKLIKPAPYMVPADGYPTRQAAERLRKAFAHLMAKRLPTLLYSGFQHGHIPSYVQKHKKNFPYFLKIDIEKFYPSIPHKELCVQVQLAYRALLGIRYVPRSFKAWFLPAYWQFVRTLPAEVYGIPLNSAMSKALSPLVYTPFF